jgi:hypothetical protein
MDARAEGMAKALEAALQGQWANRAAHAFYHIDSSVQVHVVARQIESGRHKADLNNPYDSSALYDFIAEVRYDPPGLAASEPARS